MLAVLLFSTPALAGLTITDRQQASTDLTTGPQFFGFGSGIDVSAGSSTNWSGFVLEGLEIDQTSGALILGRSGDVAPSAIVWHDDASSTRACESEAVQSVRSLTFDAQREIEAGRLRADLADLRAFAVADGAAVPLRTGSPTPTSVVVDTSAFDAATAVCLYWGNPAAASVSDSTVRGPVVADGGWSWRVWEGVGDGLSLALVDWTSPTASATVPTAAVPASVCNQCANELVGFVTPTESGTYRFFLSADDVGRLELAPLDDPAGLAPAVEIVVATPAGSFTDPAQVSAPVELVADQAYAIRARSKDLEDTDHLEIAWAIDGEPATILPSENLSDAAGNPGALTHHRFDLVETADRSGEPTSTVRIEASQTPVNSGDEVANAISGYVVVPEAGSYRFWLSSDDEGTLRLASDGNPTSARRVAWLTNFTQADNWTADPSQRSEVFELAAGQVVWIEAYNRDRGGPDHLQVGWSRDDTDPSAGPSLLPPDVLSENAPVESPLPAADLGAIEGRQAAGGTFVSPPFDTTPGGSNVFGRFQRSSSGDVTIDASFANAPDGPWTDPVALIDGVPAPLDIDGFRYVRFSGELNAGADDAPSVSDVGVERDLSEAPSVDATSTVSAGAGGDQVVLRVRGSVGAPAIATISSSSSAAFTLTSASASGLSEVPFGNGESHHVVVAVVPGTGSANARWVVADDRGAVIVHDIVVLVD